MRILILGHKGMLGHDLILRFSAGNEITGKDIEDFDLASAADCREIVKEASPEVVINAAAYTDVDGCETNHDLCFGVNARGVRNIALACGPEIRVVHFSTDYVFDGTKKNPYIEDDPCCPINVYGESKMQGEIYLRENTPNYLLIRTAWLYGKNGKNFVKAIIGRAETGQPLEVVTDQIGSPTFSYDLAGAVRLLVEGNLRGIFHITNRGSCSWYDFAKMILKYAKKENPVLPITSDRLQRKAMRPLYSVLSGRKFAETTGKTMRFWQIALADYLGIQGYQSHPRREEPLRDAGEPGK